MGSRPAAHRKSLSKTNCTGHLNRDGPYLVHRLVNRFSSLERPLEADHTAPFIRAALIEVGHVEHLRRNRESRDDFEVHVRDGSKVFRFVVRELGVEREFFRQRRGNAAPKRIVAIPCRETVSTAE